MARRNTVVRAGLAVALAAALAGAAVLCGCGKSRPKPVTIRGAVIRQDTDPSKTVPIAGVLITAADGSAAGVFKSDASGFFTITFRPEVRPGQFVELRFRHPEYRVLQLTEPVTDDLYIIRMISLRHEPPPPDSHQPSVVVGNVSVRYSEKTTSAVNIGSAVKTFQIVNTGNVPCDGTPPCSPDHKWKAALGSTSLDAGEGNEFRNATVSCIAGPCPFTKIESDGFSKGGRNISVSVLNWSDTTTFLLQAEVAHPMASDIVHRSYPVILGRGFNFTLPASADGPSIEADINTQPIIFPLGPAAKLSWADCNLRVDQDQSKVYECELKSGYRFR